MSLRVAIIGFGSVGRGVLKVLSERKDDTFKVIAITDSKGAVLDDNGLDLADVLKRRITATLRGLISRAWTS